MCDVQELLTELCETFKRSKDLRRQEMVKLLNQVRCCECGHKTRMQNVQELKSGGKSSSKLRNLLILCLVLMLLFIVYVLHVARRYNHVRAYGSNACGSTFFYTYTDCDVFF